MSARTLRVLVVDDEEVVRLFVVRVLEALGYTCDQAMDGRDAIKRFQAEPLFDVVFLDLVMPRMDGEITLRELLKIHPGLDVIMVSVQDDEEAIKDLLAKGAHAYLTKPISIAQLEHVMEQLERQRSPKS